MLWRKVIASRAFSVLKTENWTSKIVIESYNTEFLWLKGAFDCGSVTTTNVAGQTYYIIFARYSEWTDKLAANNRVNRQHTPSNGGCVI